jgi:hypothetical protein
VFFDFGITMFAIYLNNLLSVSFSLFKMVVFEEFCEGQRLWLELPLLVIRIDNIKFVSSRTFCDSLH